MMYIYIMHIQRDPISLHGQLAILGTDYGLTDGHEGSLEVTLYNYSLSLKGDYMIIKEYFQLFIFVKKR